MKDNSIREEAKIVFMPDDLWHFPDNEDGTPGDVYADLYDIIDLGWTVNAFYQEQDTANLVVELYRVTVESEEDDE